MEKRNLLLAFRSERERAALAEAFSGLEGITLLPPTGDAATVLRLLEQGRVDILVLEMMLDSAQGQPVLAALNALPERRRPLLFLITPYTEDRLLAPWAGDTVRCFIRPYLPELLVLLPEPELLPEPVQAPESVQQPVRQPVE